MSEDAPVEYRTIERFPDYRFGSDGTVWSCRPKNGWPIGWRLKQQTLIKDRYLAVSLEFQGQTKVFRVHRLASHHARLTEAQVAEIRRLLRLGLTCNAIGQRFGVSFQHVSNIGRRKKWAHLPVVSRCSEADEPTGEDDGSEREPGEDGP